MTELKIHIPDCFHEHLNDAMLSDIPLVVRLDSHKSSCSSSMVSLTNDHVASNADIVVKDSSRASVSSDNGSNDSGYIEKEGKKKKGKMSNLLQSLKSSGKDGSFKKKKKMKEVKVEGKVAKFNHHLTYAPYDYWVKIGFSVEFRSL